MDWERNPLLYLVVFIVVRQTLALSVNEQADVARGQCYSVCLQKFGSFQSTDPEAEIYAFYKPTLRCDSTSCQQCLIPCNRIFDSIFNCKRSCDGNEACRDSCQLVFDTLDRILDEGDHTVSTQHVVVGKVQQCCQDVTDTQLQSSPSLTSKEGTTLYIRWTAEGSSDDLPTLGLPLSFLIKVRSRKLNNSASPWQTFHSLDAWLPLNVDTDISYQFQVVPVLQDGVAGNRSESPWINTHSGDVILQPPRNVSIAQEVMSNQVWILVSWDPPSIPVCHYEIHILPMDDSVTSGQTKRISWLPEAKIRYGPLDFSSRYNLRLVSCTRQFTCSSESAAITFRTVSCRAAVERAGADCKPDSPDGLTVRRLAVDGCKMHMVVEWQGEDYLYQLTWYPDSPTFSNHTIADVNVTSYTITGLAVNRDYYLTVRAVSESGQTSAPTAVTINTTLPGTQYCDDFTHQGNVHPVDTSIPWLRVILPCVLAVAGLLVALGLAYRHVRKSRSHPATKTHCSNSNPLYVPIDPNSNSDAACDRFEIRHSQLERLGLLGEGAFGSVYRARMSPCPNQPDNNNTPLDVAVKYLKEFSLEEDKLKFVKEIELMKTLGRHPNVVSMVACISRGAEPALVMDYCSHGDLKVYLRGLRSGTSMPNGEDNNTDRIYGGTKPGHDVMDDDVKEQQLLSYARQIAVGMEYLSSRKFVHRDLAARNVLVCDRHLVKISDFGLTRDVYEDSIYQKSGPGKLPVKWMSPEAIFDQMYSCQSDVWSFGVLLWEIVTLGGSPYPGVATQALYKLLKEGYRMEKPENCSDEVYQLMLSCWRDAPAERPTFSSLKERFDVMLEAKLDNECAYISFNTHCNEELYAPATTSGSCTPHVDLDVSCALTCETELHLNPTSVSCIV